MKLNLDQISREWQEKARKFAEDELIPCELDAEMNEGRLPAEVAKRHREMAVELGFSSMDVPREHGGLDLRTVDQVAVWEQLGRVTNALCWCFSEPHDWMFEACNDDQLQRYILPLILCSLALFALSTSDLLGASHTAPWGGLPVILHEEFITSRADSRFLPSRISERVSTKSLSACLKVFVSSTA